MAIKYHAQKQAFELLCLFDEICRKNTINYSLGFETLYGADKISGFLQSSYSASIIMHINEYNKFLQVIQLEIKEPYYIQNYKTFDRADFFHTLLKKRSDVILPKDRKKDETYYDYAIEIFPICFAGDTRQELDFIQNKYIYNSNVFSSHRYGDFGGVKKTKLYKNVISPLLDKDKEDAKKQIIDMVENTELKAYIFIPKAVYLDDKKLQLKKYNSNRRTTQGVIPLLETYNEYCEIIFEDRKFMVIKNYKKWLADYYEKQYTDGDISNDYINQMGNIIMLSGYEQLRRMQMILLENILEIDRICKKHGVKYSIICGTLLGAERHGGIIPWDYDADVVMLKEEYEKFMKVALKEVNKEKFLITHNYDGYHNHLMHTKMRRKDTCLDRYVNTSKDVHQEIGIDIFILYNAPKSRFFQCFQTIICNYVFKTIIWSNTRRKSLPLTYANLKYKVLGLIPASWAFKGYMFFANICGKKKSEYVSWLVAKINPYKIDFSKKSNYTEVSTASLEGYTLPCPKNSKEMLIGNYGEDYLTMPAGAIKTVNFQGLALDTGTFDTVQPRDNNEEKII